MAAVAQKAGSSKTYTTNYDDKRLTDVTKAEQDAINESAQTWDKQIADSQGFFDKQIEASKDWAETQKKNQQAQTDFAIDKIEQEKAQAKKDYTKEQSGAYVDWQKQSNQYGVNAEQMAAGGMTNTGFSESSQVSMFNTYQNRVTAARESYQRAVLNYNNSIQEAKLQNNSILAEIAYKALQEQLTLALEGFQYKNQLIEKKTADKRALQSLYQTKYQSVLDAIYKEDALNEDRRQHNETLAEQRRQYNLDLKFKKAQFEWQKAQASKSSSSGSSGGSSGGRIKKTSKSSSKSSSGSSSISKSTKSAKSSKKSSSPTVDMKSVTKLGFGPISEARLNQLVSDGIVAEYVENGKIKFKKVFSSGARGGR
jgi:hypothetical protein